MKSLTIFLATACCVYSITPQAKTDPVDNTKAYIVKMLDHQDDLLTIGRACTGLDSGIVQSVSCSVGKVSGTLSHILDLLLIYDSLDAAGKKKVLPFLLGNMEFFCKDLGLEIKSLSHNMAHAERKGLIHEISEIRKDFRQIRKDYKYPQE